jgi:hypothetical protein
VAGRLGVGPAGVERAAGLLGGVGQLAGPLQQRVAVLQVGAHAPGPGCGLVTAVGGHGLELAGAPEPGRQLAPDPLVDLDPANRSVGAGRTQVGGTERDAELGRRVAVGAHEEPRQLLGECGAVVGARGENG